MGSFCETKYQDSETFFQTTLRSQSHMNLERINAEKPSQQHVVILYKLTKTINENHEKLLKVYYSEILMWHRLSGA